MATLRNHPGYWLRDDAAAAFDQAEADHGVFIVNSAGRTVGEQQHLINLWNQGGTYNRPPYLYQPANPPESSYHVKDGGIAVDLGDWRRFAQICENYGFRHTYPGSDPVHFEFVGGGAGNWNGGVSATVQAQQNWLISRGYDLGPSGADGIAGPMYAAAVQRYQTFLRAYGYSGDIDGQWGPGTQAAHEKFAASIVQVPTAPAFPLGAGQYFGPEGGGENSISGYYSFGGELKVFQQRMKDRGWPITVDGLYGPMGATTPQGNTAEVVVAFQKEKGLEPDGLIGPQTWAAAWSAPVTTTPPTPAEPNPTDSTPPSVPDDEVAATPNLISPTVSDFPSWIRFDTVLDADGQGANHNKIAAEYYGKPYNPVESHVHWWGEPGKGGSHDGNVSYITNTKDLSVNFVVSAGRITLMVPINKLALTTGARNPFAWKSENDPTITDLSQDELGYRTMGYLHYILEKLNPGLLNQPIRHHKEFYATSCSQLDKAKVRDYAEKFRTGKLDSATGKPPVIDVPDIPDPTPDPPLTVAVNKDFYDKVLKKLPQEFRSLAEDLDEGLV